MGLMLLPEELLILIVKKLDLLSQIYLHQTCSYLSKIVTHCGVIKVCDVPPGPLASPNILKRDFFKGISGHLKVLNLCAVSNLTRSAILPAMKKLEVLETLDVSYTNIIIPDLVDIKKLCPVLKNISINFLFGKLVIIPQKVLAQCQNVFQHFENVEFVGEMNNLLRSQLPLYVLNKATSLNEVKFTVINCKHTIYCNIGSNEFVKLPKFNYLQLQLLPWNQFSAHPIQNSYCVILPMLDVIKTEIEYFIIQVDNDMQVKRWHSDVFKNFFRENCGKPFDPINRLDSMDLGKNLMYLIWNKGTTVFNEAFFSKLSSKIKYLLPHHILASCIHESAPASKDIGWLSVCLDSKSVPARQATEPLAKKQRVGLTNCMVDFDDYLKEINSLKLTLQFLSRPTVCLNSTSVYLRKLTYLNLIGSVNFSRDFFNVLFECCITLETLNVEPKDSVSCAKSISHSIFLSASIKNFRLAEWIHGDSINVLLNSITKCKLIENVHISNKNTVNTELNDLSLMVAKCTNLYSLYIRNMMTYINQSTVLRLLNNAKTKYDKSYLNLELYCTYSGSSYNPYIAVFNLNPIKRF